MTSKTNEKQQYRGWVLQQKIIKADQPTMVYVQLECDTGDIVHAIYARKALTFLMEVQEGDYISIFGHHNARGQFVIERYLSATLQTNRWKDHPDHLHYPHKKN